MIMLPDMRPRHNPTIPYSSISKNEITTVTMPDKKSMTTFLFKFSVKVIKDPSISITKYCKVNIIIIRLEGLPQNSFLPNQISIKDSLKLNMLHPKEMNIVQDIK